MLVNWIETESAFWLDGADCFRGSCKGKKNRPVHNSALKGGEQALGLGRRGNEISLGPSAWRMSGSAKSRLGLQSQLAVAGPSFFLTLTLIPTFSSDQSNRRFCRTGLNRNWLYYPCHLPGHETRLGWMKDRAQRETVFLLNILLLYFIELELVNVQPVQK